jgi:hypothetical protein
MKARFVVIGLLLSALVASSGLATIDKTVFKCESKASAAVNKFGAARGKCIVKCAAANSKDPNSRVCPPTDPNAPEAGIDSTTAACIDAANMKYKASVSKACGGTMPACGTYLDSMTMLPRSSSDYADAQIASQGALIDGETLPFLLCDPDPNTPVNEAIKCESKTVATLAKLSGAVAKCLTKCDTKALVKGDMTVDCDPNANLDASSLDTTTGGCVTAAVSKASASINKACNPLPACGAYLIGVDNLLGFVVAPIGQNYENPDANPYCDPNGP